MKEKIEFAKSRYGELLWCNKSNSVVLRGAAKTGKLG